jgi:hypothetical protein
MDHIWHIGYPLNDFRRKTIGFSFKEDIAWKNIPIEDNLFAVPDFIYFLRRHQYLRDDIIPAGTFDLELNPLLDLPFLTGNDPQ